MAGTESLVQVTEGSGKKLHTYQRTIGGNAVEDEAVIPGEYPIASYIAEFENVSTAVANTHILQIMASASLKVRIRRIRIQQETSATTASITRWTIVRLTTAGTGGTAVTPRPFDSGDAAAGGSAMTVPTAKGTEGVTLLPVVLVFRQAILATASQIEGNGWEWTQHPGTPPLVIPTGTANGIAIRTGSAIAAATVTGFIEYSETSF